MLRPAGEQALANVLYVAELARQYEQGGGISFRGFIDELRDGAASTEAAEATILEEGSDGVRLMTVHKAKGLEFPVVILADLTCRLSRSDASRYLDAARGLCAMKIGGWAPHDLHEHEAEEIARDQAEGVRLAYVAATRARDLLVVPVVGDEPWEGGWFSPLNRALYPPVGTRRQAVRGPKCPTFKSKDSVLQRPGDEPAGPATVCPGLHAFSAGRGYSVVWWDPSALALGAKPPFGVRREELILKDVPRNVVADGRSRVRVVDRVAPAEDALAARAKSMRATELELRLRVYFDGLKQIVDPAISGVTTQQTLQGSFSNFAIADANGKLLLVNPSPGQVGNLGLKWIEAPSRMTFDMNLLKRIQLAESKEFELRMDAINVLNHPIFDNPNLNINSTDFGRITTAMFAARTFVLNARVNF